MQRIAGLGRTTFFRNEAHANFRRWSNEQIHQKRDHKFRL